MSQSESRNDAGDDGDAPRDRSRSEFPRSDTPKSERAVPDFVRRLLEAGLEKLAEQPDQLRQRLADLKLPKETLATLLSQIDDGKSGLYRVVAKELRDFLQNTNFAEDLVRALTKLSFEIKTEIRFIPNDAGIASPKVKSRVRVKADAAPTDSSQNDDAPEERAQPDSESHE